MTVNVVRYVHPHLFCLCAPLHLVSAGKATTDEELEEMLESGNAAVFTAGVRDNARVRALLIVLFTFGFLDCKAQSPVTCCTLTGQQ